MCQVDGYSMEIKFKGFSSKSDGVLYLAGLPDSSELPELDRNATCIPKVLNFSGCIADLEMNFVSSRGHVQRFNTTHAQQFGDVFETCDESKDFIVSISGKNSKILFSTRDNFRCNASFEFQIRTLVPRAFVGKIINQMFTALFFLEEGKIKVTVRFEDPNTQKGNLIHLASRGIFLANNEWHKVTFIIAEKAETTLRIDDELTSSYKLTNKLLCAVPEDKKEYYNTIRFGRSARKYPSFTGCLRDVYVNNDSINFSRLDPSKGISVGTCHDASSKSKPSLIDQNRENPTLLSSTTDAFVFTKSFHSKAYEMSTTPPGKLNGSSNSSGGILEALTPDTIPQARGTSHYDRAYPIAIALAVGMLLVFIVIAYVFGAGLKSRFRNCCDKTMMATNDQSKFSTVAQERDKDSSSCQSPANGSKNLRASGKDQQRHSKCNLHVPIANRESYCQDICKSAREFHQTPIKAWEDRYLGHASKTLDSNLLTVPQLQYSHVHHNWNARSREKVSNDLENVVTSKNIPPPDEGVVLQKHGFAIGLLHDSMVEYPDEGGGRRILTVVNSSSPKRVNKVYSGHDSLPKSKKMPSLSWAYGARFVRNGHESSDTDCSEIDRVTRVRSRDAQVLENGKVITIRPRHFKHPESSEDEQDDRAWNENHSGRGRRLRTFTEKSYKLQSLKEEDREVDVDQRSSFTCNRLKVYCKDIYNMRGWNRSTSLTEATVRCGDTVAIGNQVKSLDGYTSSCPESIHCLSEKEDKRPDIRRSKRLTTHYF